MVPPRSPCALPLLALVVRVADGVGLPVGFHTAVGDLTVGGSGSWSTCSPCSLKAQVLVYTDGSADVFASIDKGNKKFGRIFESGQFYVSEKKDVAGSATHPPAVSAAHPQHHATTSTKFFLMALVGAVSVRGASPTTKAVGLAVSAAALLVAAVNLPAESAGIWSMECTDNPVFDGKEIDVSLNVSSDGKLTASAGQWFIPSLLSPSVTVTSLEIYGDIPPQYLEVASKYIDRDGNAISMSVSGQKGTVNGKKVIGVHRAAKTVDRDSGRAIWLEGTTPAGGTAVDGTTPAVCLALEGGTAVRLELQGRFLEVTDLPGGSTQCDGGSNNTVQYSESWTTAAPEQVAASKAPGGALAAAAAIMVVLANVFASLP